MSASLKANEPSMEEILASIRRIIAEDASPKDPEPELPPQPPESAAASEDLDVLDLATIDQPEEADNDIEFREVSEPLIVSQPAEAEPELAHEPEPEIPPQAAPARPDPVAIPVQDTLMSPLTAAAVASAFGALGSAQLPRNGLTLEDLVKDMLRPLLKGWLDENLPGLVERLVRAEIERVSRTPHS